MVGPAIKSIDRRTFLGHGLKGVALAPFLFFGCSRFSFSSKSSHAFSKFIANTKARNSSELGLTYYAQELTCKSEDNHFICHGKNEKILALNEFGESFEIDLPLPGHSYLQWPLSKNLVWAIPAFHKSSALLDLNTGSIQDFIHSEDYFFYGHGIIDSSEKFAYATMAQVDDPNKGIIGKFDLESRKMISHFFLQGASYHDLMLSPDQKSLIVAGKKSKEASVFVISLTDFTLTSSVTSPERFEFRHIKKISDDVFLMTGKSQEGAISSKSICPIALYELEANSLKILAFSDSDNYEGEGLNVIIEDDNNLIHVINPYKGDCYQVDMQSFTMKKKVHLPIKGVQKIGRALLATSNDIHHSVIFKGETMNDLPQKSFTQSELDSGFGSHIVKISIG